MQKWRRYARLLLFRSTTALFFSCPPVRMAFGCPANDFEAGLLLYRHLNTHTHTPFSRCWSKQSISLLLLSRHHIPAHLIRSNPLHIKNLLSAANVNTHSPNIILTIEVNGTCCILHGWSGGVKDGVGSLFIFTRVSLGLHQQQGEERHIVPGSFPSTL